jgi:hypothetical protein
MASSRKHRAHPAAAVAVVAMALLALSSGCGSEQHKSGDLLYVQTGGPGRFDRQPDGRYALTIRDVRPRVIFFADRPKRIAGTLDMGALFAGVFAHGDPPNAALAMDLPGDEHDTIVPLELLHPNYDAGQRRLSYTARLLSAGSDGLPQFAYADPTDRLPNRFVHGELFIDNGSRTLHDTCYSTISTHYDLSLANADPAEGDRHYAALPDMIYGSDLEGNFELAYNASHGFLGVEDGGTHATVTYNTVNGNAPYDTAVIHLHCNINGAYRKDSYCYTYENATPDQHSPCGMETGSDGYGGTAIQFNLP